MFYVFVLAKVSHTTGANHKKIHGRADAMSNRTNQH